MNTAAYFIVTVILAAALYFGIRWLVRVSTKYRGTKVVTCPETGRPALAEVDALHASLTSVGGRPDIRLENCSRWPLKNQCGLVGIRGEEHLGHDSDCARDAI